MRKSSWWMILVALLTITAPTAFADSFSIAFNGGTTTPEDASISVFNCNAMNCLLDIGTVSDTGVGAMFTFSNPPLLTTAAPQMDSYQWFLTSGSNVMIVVDTSTGDAVGGVSPNASLFTDAGSAIVSLTTAPVPEPSPVVLTLIGMGLLVVMRKR